MKRILFVCLGNICRSPMAEYVFRDLVEKQGLGAKYAVASAATSAEEIGNGVHYGTREKLREHGISTAGKRAVRLERGDYQTYDLLVGMETRNLTDMRRITGGDPDGKTCRLLDFSSRPRDIADPWYTGNFTLTYGDVLEGCEALLEKLENE